METILAGVAFGITSRFLYLHKEEPTAGSDQRITTATSPALPATIPTSKEGDALSAASGCSVHLDPISSYNLPADNDLHRIT